MKANNKMPRLFPIIGNLFGQDAVSATKNLTVYAKAGATITISLSPTTVSVGEAVTISGVFTSGSGAPAAMCTANLMVNGSKVNQQVTGSGGNYSFTWSPSSEGSYSIVVEGLFGPPAGY